MPRPDPPAPNVPNFTNVKYPHPDDIPPKRRRDWRPSRDQKLTTIFLVAVALDIASDWLS